VSTIKVDTITDTSGNSIPYMKGAVLQMPFTQYTSTTSVSMSATANVSVDVLSVNITPKSTNSIIKLDTGIFHEWGNAGATYNCAWFFYRDSTKLAHTQDGNRLCGISTSAINFTGADAGSTVETTYYSYFDSPNTTNQVTYKVGVVSNYSTSVYINRTVTDNNSSEMERGISFISATEIGG